MEKINVAICVYTVSAVTVHTENYFCTRVAVVTEKQIKEVMIKNL